MWTPQAALFPLDWSARDCRDWLARHGMLPIKRVHVTTGRRRYRLAEPSGDRFRVVHMGDVEVIVMRP